MMPRITVSLCLHLPAGKSCRQNGGFNTRMLPHSSQGTLPFPCSARGRRPSPHLCLEYQCLAVDRGTRNLPRESSAASQLMCPLLLSGRGGLAGRGSAAWASAAVTVPEVCPIALPPLSVFHLSTLSYPQILQVSCVPWGCLSLLFQDIDAHCTVTSSHGGNCYDSHLCCRLFSEP